MADLKDRDRLLVVLDLDECLIHSRDVPFVGHSADFCPCDGIYTIRRPGLEDFLRNALATFDVAVWSSGSADYVAAIVRNIFADPARLKFVWSRSRCTERRDEAGDTYWEKSISKVKRQGYSLARTVIIDDDKRTARQNFGNLVSIAPFTGNAEDAALARVMRILQRLQGVEDVRRVPKA